MSGGGEDRARGRRKNHGRTHTFAGGAALPLHPSPGVAAPLLLRTKLTLINYTSATTTAAAIVNATA